MGLLDQVHSFTQGASNGVAGSLTGPVDGLAWLLRKAGVPMPDAPMGGSDWMRNNGLMQEPTQRLAGLLGEGIGSALPTVMAGKAPQIANGLLQMEANAMAPRTLNPQTGAIVWHGSPHKFDKFDSSKIGTGEGAQSYGHGLYLAENPKVASTYGDGSLGFSLRGKKIDTTVGSTEDVTGALHSSFLRQGLSDEESLIMSHALSDVNGMDPLQKLKEIAQKNAHNNYGEIAKKLQNDIDIGSLYQVDLPDEHIAKMLDWDKPLSQQAPGVQTAVQKLVPPFNEDAVNAIRSQMENASMLARSATDASTKKAAIQEHGRLLNSLRTRQPDVSGKDLMGYFDSPVQASAAFRDAGIPGIRYLDGGSRAGGAGTSNYVVFPGNEDLLKIIERNGQGLLGN